MQLWTAAMRAGRYDQAWAIATQSVLERDAAECDNSALPYHQRWVWDGKSIDGRDVLVRCYHGLGDTIQFARFLPALARRARSVTVEAQPRLVDLLSTIHASMTLVPFDLERPLPCRDVAVEITELDAVLRIRPDELATPYLRAPRAILPEGTVALCYGAGDWDPERSLPAELLSPLCAEARILTLMPESTTLPVLNPRGCPMDMATTAAMVASAALVITVDTMVAHLAGALGKSTWLLLKAEPDWRWDPAKRVSAWYPSMRLYAQPRPGDWQSVIAAVAHDLRLRFPATVEK